MKPIFTSLLLLPLVAFPSIAAEEKPYELTPLIGYRFGGDFEIKADGMTRKVKTKEASSYGLLFSFPYDNKRQSEILFSHYDSNLSVTQGILPVPRNNDVEAGLSVSYLHLGGNVPVTDSDAPVKVSGGFGLTYLSPDDSRLSNETQFSMNIGVNKKFPISESVSFRLGSRVYGTLFDSNSKIFCGTDACGMYISGSLWVQAELNAGVSFAF